MSMNKKLWLILLSAGIAGLAILWATLPRQGGYAFDDDFRVYMAGWADDGWTAVMRTLDKVGSTTGMIVLTLLIAAIMWRRWGKKQALMLVGTMAVGYALNTAIKASVDRMRPAQAWGIEVDGASFPSGNAMMGLILFGLTAVFLLSSHGGRGWLKGFAAAFCMLMILLQGISRLYFHVHYLTDILAGYATGLIVIAAAMLLFGGDGRKSEWKGRGRLS